MVKDDSDNERRNLLLPLHRLFFVTSTKGPFICTISQKREFTSYVALTETWKSSMGWPDGFDLRTYSTTSRGSIMRYVSLLFKEHCTTSRGSTMSYVSLLFKEHCTTSRGSITSYVSPHLKITLFNGTRQYNIQKFYKTIFVKKRTKKIKATETNK